MQQPVGADSEPKGGNAEGAADAAPPAATPPPDPPVQPAEAATPAEVAAGAAAQAAPGRDRPDWMGQEVALDADGLPKPLRWRPVFAWRALAFGFLFDLAAEVLLQQLGKQLLTVYSFFHAAIVGAIVGVVAPSVGRFAGVWWANRTIRRAREQAAGGAGASE